MSFSWFPSRLALRCIIFWGYLLLGMLLMGHSASAKVLYVTGSSGLDTNDGLSWSTAKKTVQAAVTTAASGDQVWVSKGTYMENITLATGVGLYGGFSGTETKLSDRNSTTNVTILDGGANSLPVVTISNGDVNTVLDGFLVRNASGGINGIGAVTVSGPAIVANNSIQNNSAAGIICPVGSPRLINNRIIYNSGDAIYCSGSATISGNLIAWNFNGGISCDNKGTPTIIGNRIQANGTSGGFTYGLVCDTASPIVRNNVIAWNQSADVGGVYLNRSSAVLTNNTIVYNSSGSIQAGAVTLDNLNSPTSNYTPVLANNIIAFNSAGILLTTAAVGHVNPVLKHNCFFGNTGFDVSGLTAGATDLFTDPQLLDLLRGDYHLSPNSPCIDSGDDTYVTMGDTDIDGDKRLTYTHVDIGADEFVAPRTVVPTRHVVYVSPSGNANNDGATWATAKNKVQDALNIAYSGDLVWTAAGTYVEKSVSLNAGIALYGGFSGSETLVEQRNPAVNLTTLAGVVTSIGGTLEGFTIQNGGVNCSGLSTINLNTIMQGGGIYAQGESTITNNSITGSTYTGVQCLPDPNPKHGQSAHIVGNTISNNTNSGILVKQCTPFISANIISGNGSTGIVCSYASPTIIRNTISGNINTDPGNTDPPGGGGGISCTGSSPLIASNVILANKAHDGGGIFLTYSSPTISNNTIVGNIATTANMAGGISMVVSCNPAIANNIVVNNTGFGIWRQITTKTSSPTLSHNDVFGNATNYVGLSAGGGDFSADPLFVKVVAGSYSTGNYHLTRNSPVINAGDNNAVPRGIPDHDGNARIAYTTVDVGAYEFGQRFDFNNDRVADLLFQNQQNGAIGCWFMNNTRYQSSAVLATSVPTEWKVVATGDLNSDQNLDLLFQNQNTGAVAYWLLNGTTLTASGTIAASVPTEWQVVGAPDLNADGMPDLLWQNAKTGDVVCWFLNGVTFLRYTTIATAVPLDWKIVATADINGDGMPDLLWQNQKSGAVAYWLMNGINVIGSGQIAASVPLVWKVMGAPDLNGDGKADLLWANQQTGDVTYWLLDGSTLIGSGTISSGVPLVWQLAGMR